VDYGKGYGSTWPNRHESTSYEQATYGIARLGVPPLILP